MHCSSRKSTLLIICLNAVALSGCTRFDNGEVRRFPIKASRRTTATQRIETIVPTPDAPGESIPPEKASPQTLPPTAPVPMNNASGEPVLDELDAALRDLESLLGSTEDWDVPQP
jgi:hypothetical protein